MAEPATPIKNGAPPAAPQHPVTPPVQSAPDPRDVRVQELEARAKTLEQERDRAKRDDIVNRRAAESKIKSFGEKLKAADEYERIRRLARVNKVEAAKLMFGEKWHEELNTIQANGGAPTAESVQLAIEEAEQRAASRAIEEFKKQQAAEREQHAKGEEARTQAQLREFATSALAFAKDSAKDFPLSALRYEGEQRFAAAVAQRVRDVFDKTVKRDESGIILQQGRVLTFKEAAEQLEGEEKSLFDKYGTRLQPSKSPGTVPPVVKPSQSASQSSQSVSQGRRTLSHDLTGSSPGEAPRFRSDEERRKAALARYEELASKH